MSSVRLVNKEKLLAPGKCLICESKPGGRVVDTGRKNFRNTAADPMRGRKYICDRCGSKIAEALGYPPPHKVDEYRMTIASQREQIRVLEKTAEMADKYKDLADFIESKRADVVLED